MSERWLKSFLIFFFFVSGACGLMYEIAWLRVMGLVFGNTTFATSTVLSGYMAGLGLGALALGKWVDRGRDPVRGYAYLEGGVALYALLTPLIWKLIDALHAGFYGFFKPSFLQASLFMFGVAFFALLLPTFLMGGTLPLLSRYFVRDAEAAGRSVGLLYALNTLGAVVGVLGSGFFALYTLGVRETVLLTASLNFLIFAGSMALVRFRKPVWKAPAPSGEPSSEPQGVGANASLLPGWISWLLLALFGISGAVSMMYEIGWTRVLAIALGSSVYAFSVMLATFLFGIALGSFLFSVAAKRIRPDLGSFAALQMLTAITVLLGINQFDDMPFYFAQFYQATGGSIPRLEVAKFFLSASIMLPPTVSIGAMFACFIHVTRRTARIGHEVGRAYFANTLGTIFGSALTGFVWIPLFGIHRTLVAAALINAGVGLLCFLVSPRAWHWRRTVTAGFLGLGVAAGAFAVEPWDSALITSDVAVRPRLVAGLNKQEFRKTMTEKKTVFYREGTSATVSVNQWRDNLSLSVNGKVDASNEDAFTQFLLGHLPMLLHPQAKRVFVIGMGSGSTLSAVAAHPVRRIDCVEIEKAVVEGALFFSRLNRNVLRDERVRVFINDGRNMLRLMPDTYDVIISEPSNPWMAGVANLFSYEHYQTMRSRLNPDGVVCQWLHAYSMSPEDLKMIVRTFTLVFEDVSLWASYYPDLMLIGRREARPVDFRHIRNSFRNPVVRGDLWPHGVRRPEGFFASFWLGDADLRRLGEGARVNSDNHPYLEFSAPRYLYRDTALDNFTMLNIYRREEYPAIAHLYPPVERNTAFYDAVARALIGQRLYDRAERFLERSNEIRPGHAEYLELAGRAQFERGNPAAAEEFLSRAVAVRPESAEARLFLGRILARKGENEKAREHLQKAVALSPRDLPSLLVLAEFLAETGDARRAISFYGRFLALRHGRDFSVVNKMAEAAAKSGDLPRLWVFSRILFRNYPRFVPAYERLGGELEAKGLYREAVNVYRILAGTLPRESAAYINLARAYERMGQLASSREALSQAMRLDPTLAKNPAFARVLEQLNR
jgi:spermidine synthase